MGRWKVFINNILLSFEFGFGFSRISHRRNVLFIVCLFCLFFFFKGMIYVEVGGDKGALSRLILTSSLSFFRFNHRSDDPQNLKDGKLKTKGSNAIVNKRVKCN